MKKPSLQEVLAHEARHVNRLADALLVAASECAEERSLSPGAVLGAFVTYDPTPRRPTSPKIDPDVYTVRLVDVRTERGPNKFRPGEERTSRVWDFELVEQKSPDHEGVLRKWTGVTGDAFIQVMKALKVPPGEVPKAQLLGRQCRAVVELTDKGYAKMSRLFPMT